MPVRAATSGPAECAAWPAVVVEQQPAARQIGHHRLERVRVGEEPPAQKIGHARVTGEARQRPDQTLGVGVLAVAGAQGVRARIAVGEIVRLHRHFEEDFVARAPRLHRRLLDVGRVRRKRQSHARGQISDRALRGLGADAEASNDDGDARAAVTERRRRISAHRCRAVIGDARQRAVGRVLDERRIGDERAARVLRLGDLLRRRRCAGVGTGGAAGSAAVVTGATPLRGVSGLMQRRDVHHHDGLPGFGIAQERYGGGARDQHHE